VGATLPPSFPSSEGAGDPRIAMARRATMMRWGAVGLVVVLVVGYFVLKGEKDIPVGVVLPNLITGPMSQSDATRILNSINGTAKLEVQDGELLVRIPTAAFPEHREGQLALAQQYARADEIIEGRKRAINFLDAAGGRFARADPQKGVSMTR
jgi:hypothetical protein